ncbi:MAG TPA: NAD-dependent epimerase/dehydratase family protein, partial [Catalimonadaceae bacterium]|nr:NAD-dependent epimerase/dehydratase family protein [Catalimonadaceae bacterium]
MSFPSLPNLLQNRVFLTGATGLLGRQIAKQLIENQYEVIALLRPGSKDRKQLVPYSSQIQWIEGDLGDLHALEEGMNRADYVIHSGALVSFDPKDRNRLHKINSEGTANVVNVALKIPHLIKLVHVSSVATLSPSKPQPADIDERQGFNPNKNTSDYARSKYLAELEVIRSVEEGLKSVIINPSIILSAGGPDESSASLLDYVQKRRPFYTSGWINYVDVRDVASVVVQLLTQGPSDGQRIILSAGHLE